MQHAGIDPVGFTDQTEIEVAFDLAIGIRDAAGELAGADQPAILARNTNGERAGAIDEADDLLVDRAGEDHFDHFDHGGIGDTEPFDEGGLNFQPGEHGVDLRAAAMDDDRVDADLLEQRDIGAELGGEVFLTHGMAAIFDDDGGAGIAAQVGQCVGQDFGLRGRRDHRHIAILHSAGVDFSQSERARLIVKNGIMGLIKHGVGPRSPRCPRGVGCEGRPIRPC